MPLKLSDALIPPGDYSPVYEGVPNGSEIRQASNVTWDDQFFEGEDDVVAVFDFDYALMEDFNTKVNWAAMLFPPFCILGTMCFHPCFLRKRVQWDVYSQHVAITRDGIRFVRDKRPTCFGCPCTDAGKISKTVPFDKITDCDIQEPAGATCICIQNVLSTVNVDTASSGMTQEGVTRHELTIRGLRDPHSFKKLVWAMKRSNGETYRASVSGMGNAPMVEAMVRGVSGKESEDVPRLLREIRDEMKEQTRMLKAQQACSSSSPEISPTLE